MTLAAISENWIWNSLFLHAGSCKQNLHDRNGTPGCSLLNAKVQSNFVTMELIGSLVRTRNRSVIASSGGHYLMTMIETMIEWRMWWLGSQVMTVISNSNFLVMQLSRKQGFAFPCCVIDLLEFVCHILSLCLCIVRSPRPPLYSNFAESNTFLTTNFHVHK